MITKKERISKALKRYLPEGYIPYVVELMFSEKLAFRISKPRKTKAGDYRAPYQGKPHRISINGDLNPYAFLITTLHEFAHMKTYIKYGASVQPHGQEWKNEFKHLLAPILEKKELPLEIEAALKQSLQNLKASSCSDIHLNRALKMHDPIDESIVLLENLGNNQYFRLGKSTYQRGILRRRRYLCKEMNTGKYYLVDRLAEVEPVNKQQ